MATDNMNTMEERTHQTLSDIKKLQKVEQELYDNLEQGHFFNMHKDVYCKALSQILNCSKKIDVILWHQGETDNLRNSDLHYYNVALLKVIEQYTKLNNNLQTPFIAGTISSS